jgi:hypothetical protein
MDEITKYGGTATPRQLHFVMSKAILKRNRQDHIPLSYLPKPKNKSVAGPPTQLCSNLIIFSKRV